MGTKRTHSSQRLRIRVSQAPPKRDTLIPCPACGSRGEQVFNDHQGRYRHRRCPWCDGNGCTDHVTVGMFARWQRIHQHNRAVGACPVKKKG